MSQDSAGNVNQQMRVNMREILVTLFRGWKFHNEKYYDKETGEYNKTAEEVYAEICGGDILLGETLPLLSHWDWDLMSIAPHYGISCDYDESTHTYTIREDVPLAPSPKHYWLDGAWYLPDTSETTDAPAAA